MTAIPFLLGTSGAGGGAGVPASGRTMTVGSYEFVDDYDTGITNKFYDGYVSWSSAAALTTGAFGGIIPATALGATIVALYWRSITDHSTNGQVYIEFSGNRAAGFLTSVSADTVSLGSVGGSPTYNSGSDSTTFLLGSSGVANPFGTSGTVTIDIT